ncbi:MAG: DUF2059 domain-containing protein [Opitutales bacterium]
MKIANILLAILALSPAGFAQDNTPKPAPAAPAPAAPAPVDPAKLALAREVIAAMHADKMFDGMVTQMKQMVTQMASFPPATTPEKRKVFEEFQAKALELSMTSAKGLVARMDQIYADVYSETELRAMQDFFGSATGQSMLAKQPQVMSHLMPLVQDMQRDLMPKVKQLVETFKADLEKLDAEAKAAAEKAAAQPAVPAQPVVPTTAPVTAPKGT